MLPLNEKNSNEVLGFLERKWGGGAVDITKTKIQINVFHVFSCVMDMNRINSLPVVPNTAQKLA